MTMIFKKGTGCFKLPILVVVGVICMTVMLLNKEWFISEEAFTFDEIESKVPIHYERSFILNGTDKAITIRGWPFRTHGLNTTFPPYYIDLNKYDLSNFTFITGSSSNHFEESKDLIASIQRFFPHKQIYYFDLGLKEKQIKQMRSWCNVVYRKFDSRPYPKHVSDLYSYAFKPLIIYEAIQIYDAVFWVDASGRLSPKVNHSNWSLIYQTARETGGIVQFDVTGRDTYQCTNTDMYRYLPADEEKLKSFEMLGANIVLLYRTEDVFRKIIRWWRLCALTKNCIEPRGHKRSCGKRVSPGVSICHRYDQSALNILAANMLNYEDLRLPKGSVFVETHRHPTTYYKLLIKGDGMAN
ncbi:hypothetical protein LSH36_40g00027 [Paralvinella palmiformis]|uniref:Uncharacterized protein n=1 Tax=Paralvinella palmiformis TaxID=53620 RepID=A0AAD9NDP4_9ANNE|nr:hypothetical protein LSH36_40g00027 [Paralvinella palmiformis]